ncbi:hypothetical protein [Bradyrhizobium sp. URHD0069]|uniref:hypothetical protein n=1 Tax=Bradyrhizobium sp. URHD0069 TaxID=1380355 RepID=UPI000494E1DB|nr:hypothetical protein [Bradyrhizobium sp. URHD0069]
MLVPIKSQRSINAFRILHGRRLKSYWHYDQCRYGKGKGSCSEPEHIGACPVPTHRLRNGRLNQTAYSFYLFTRDIAENDLVGWIDHQLSRVATKASDLSREVELQEALIGPLRHVYGVSDKTLIFSHSVGALSNNILCKQKPN